MYLTGREIFKLTVVSIVFGFIFAFTTRCARHDSASEPVKIPSSPEASDGKHAVQTEKFSALAKDLRK